MVAVVPRLLSLQLRSSELLEGRFCGHYKRLVTIDADGISSGERVFSYRKGVFTEQEQRVAYDALRPAVEKSSSRGKAAGPIRGKLNGRDFVTPEQLAILRGFINGEAPKVEPTKDNQAPVWRRKHVLTLDPEYDGWFDRWHRATVSRDTVERKKAAQHVAGFLSDRSYSVPVDSGVAGYLDGRATRFTRRHPDLFMQAFPFVRRLNELYKATCPTQWHAQSAAVEQHVEPRFRIADSVFTTLTVNHNYRTSAHRDEGNLEVGFSCLVALGSGWRGGEFIMPEYRVAVKLEPGDLLMLPSHEVIHANAPLVEDEACDRLTVIAYVPKGMLKLGSWSQELERMRFYRR